MTLKCTEELTEKQASVLSINVITFLDALYEQFAPLVMQVLEQRGNFVPGFLEETADIRSGSWKISDIPKDLEDRRVEITGPPDRKMIINALNSGANIYMADFEDSNSPTWKNCVDGQANLRDAIHNNIDFYDEKRGKAYKLKPTTAVLFIRPRGLHLIERHVIQPGATTPMPACLFDFGVYIANNMTALLETNRQPYFYLPKLEHHREAALWDQIFHLLKSILALRTERLRPLCLLRRSLLHSDG